MRGFLLKLSTWGYRLEESKNTEELQGFQLIKGKGPINANVATLRMLAEHTTHHAP